MDGALMEIGPYRTTDDSHLTYNDGSWDEFANLLFVDNPVGTGFSYVNTDSFDHELKEMANHMVIFLEKYFNLFPEHQDNDVSIQALQCCPQTDLETALLSRRILRWTAHSLYCTGYSGSK